MIKYELIINNDIEVTYKYYPEGGVVFGFVSYNKQNDSFSVENASSEDGGFYSGMMLNKMRTFISNNSYKNKGMVACF